LAYLHQVLIPYMLILLRVGRKISRDRYSEVSASRPGKTRLLLGVLRNDPPLLGLRRVLAARSGNKTDRLTALPRDNAAAPFGAVHLTQEQPMSPLRHRMIEDMQIRNLNLNTQRV